MVGFVMKKSALWKDFFMEIRSSLNRFLSIFMIVALGVAFFAGIRATNPDMRITADTYYDNSCLMDIRVLSTLGITKEDVTAISQVAGVKETEPSYSTQVVCDANGNELVLQVLSATQKLNKITVTEGRMPKSAKEVLVDPIFIESSGYHIGDSIKLSSGTDKDISETLNRNVFTIVGTGTSAYYLSFQRGTSGIGTGDVNSFIVILPETFALEAYTEVYVSVQGARELTAYTTAYETRIDETVSQIEKIATAPTWYVLDRGSIEAYAEFGQNADRIGAIGEVFPAIFFLVAALSA